MKLVKSSLTQNKTYFALICRLRNQSEALNRFNIGTQFFSPTCLGHILHRQPNVVHVWQRTWTRPNFARSVFTDGTQRDILSPASLLNCVPRFDFLTQSWCFFLNLLSELKIEDQLSFTRKIWTPIVAAFITFYLKRYRRCLTAKSFMEIKDTVIIWRPSSFCFPRSHISHYSILQVNDISNLTSSSLRKTPVTSTLNVFVKSSPYNLCSRSCFALDRCTLVRQNTRLNKDRYQALALLYYWIFQHIQEEHHHTSPTLRHNRETNQVVCHYLSVAPPQLWFLDQLYGQTLLVSRP